MLCFKTIGQKTFGRARADLKKVVAWFAII
jgi:hypothetical protein